MVLLSGIAVFLLCRNQDNFAGSRIKNPDAFLLDIDRMNGTDLHTLEQKTYYNSFFAAAKKLCEALSVS